MAAATREIKCSYLNTAGTMKEMHETSEYAKRIGYIAIQSMAIWAWKTEMILRICTVQIIHFS